MNFNKMVAVFGSGIFLSGCIVGGYNIPTGIAVYASDIYTENESSEDNKDLYDISEETAQVGASEDGLSKAELLGIIAKNQKDKYDNYNLHDSLYVDMDHDGNAELFALYAYVDDQSVYSDVSKCTLWFCSSDGKTCQEVINDEDSQTNADHMIYVGNNASVELTPLETEDETQVALNSYLDTGIHRSCMIYRYSSKKKLKEVSIPNNINVYTDEYGDIVCKIDDGEGSIGSHYSPIYIHYNGKKYTQCGALEISDKQFAKIENGNRMTEIIHSDIAGEYPDYDHVTYKYWFYENGRVTVACDVYDKDGKENQIYYPLRYEYGRLNYYGDLKSYDSNSYLHEDLTENDTTPYFDVTYPEYIDE